MVRSVPLGILTIFAVLVTTALPTGQEPARAAFPGLNGKIAFSSERAFPNEVFVMNADGSDQTNVTNNPASDGGPAWSPDGSRIAFSSNRDDPDPANCMVCNVDIYVMNADGSGVVRLTTDPTIDASPAWSPDGSQIAFATDRDGDREVYVMNADGSGQTRLTSVPGYDQAPAWSPDGSQIAFDSERDGNLEIYVMNADGGNQTNLTNDPDVDQLPNWSPDGSQIAFTSRRDGDDEVFVMNADGSGPVNLTGDPARDSSPAWSPDGTQIAFESDRDGNPDIYVMSADGSGVARLTDDPDEDNDPDWQPLQSLPTATPTSVAGPPATATVAALPDTGAGADDSGGRGAPIWLIAALGGIALATAAGYYVLRPRLR